MVSQWGYVARVGVFKPDQFRQRQSMAKKLKSIEQDAGILHMV